MATGSERAVQRAVRALSRTVLSRGAEQPIELASLRRVLVIRADDRVGNILLTTPLVRALREGLPHVRIDWLIASRRRPLVEGLFLVDELIPFDRKQNGRNPFAFARLVWRLRSTGYDAVIDAAHHDTFSISAATIARWTGARIRVGHDRGDAAHFYSHPVPPPAEVEYDVALKLELLKPFGLPARGWQLETALGRSPRIGREAETLLASVGIGGGRFVIVNPGARKPDRRFPTDKLGRLVAHIAATTGLKALIVWGPGEEELAQLTVRAAKGAAVVAPPTDLNLLAALLRRTSLLITNDTGPMHLAVACQAPVLALFTGDFASRWGHPIPTFRTIAAWPGTPDPVPAAQEAAVALIAGAEAAGR